MNVASSEDLGGPIPRNRSSFLTFWSFTFQDIKLTAHVTPQLTTTPMCAEHACKVLRDEQAHRR